MSGLEITLQNPSEINTSQPFEGEVGVEESRSQATYQQDDYVGMVFDADYQHHLINKVTPIQSATFDKRIWVSLRPQALVLATPILQRESQSKIDEEFSDYERYHLGDLIDTSNYGEWVLYLLSTLDEFVLEELFGLTAAAKSWDEVEWQAFFDSLDERQWQDYLQILSDYIEGSEQQLIPGPEGNHDGAAWGNGVSPAKSPALLELEILKKVAQKETIEKKLIRLEEKDKKDNKKLSKKITRLKRRLEYVNDKIDVLIVERDKARERGQDNPLRNGRIRLPGFIVNSFMGLSHKKTLYDPSGYWAQNSGGVANNFDKADYIYQYLRLRYPEIGVTTGDCTCAFQPLATKLQLNVLDSDPESTDYIVENVKQDPKTGEFIMDETGQYVTERSHVSFLEEKNPQRVANNFQNFWKEVRPGEYLCLVDYPNMKTEHPTQDFLMIQALEVGEVNGKKVFHFLLDGMDGTEQEMDIVFFAAMSGLQRQLCQLFIDQMRNVYEDEVLFIHSSHYPLKDHIKDYWKDFGWQDYFSQRDIVPVLFNGHGHQRMIFDETKPTLFGKHVFFGIRSVKRDDGFWSIMTPSVTDSPNEFASVKLEYDEQTDQYIVTQEYHDVFSESDEDRIPEDVFQTVANLKTIYEQERYHEYSQLRSGIITSLTNIFFSQDRILAYDSIPISIGHYEETLIYTRYFLQFLLDDFSGNDPYIKLVEKTLMDLEAHLDMWLYGNPDSDDEFDQKGYLAAVEDSKQISRRQDQIALLIHYNDIFDTPSYERLRMLIAQTPQDSKAYQFWLLLGIKAAEEERKPHSKRQERRQERKRVEDRNVFRFSLND